MVMDYKTAMAMVAAGESEQVEFKRSVAELDKGCRSLCGFLTRISQTRKRDGCFEGCGRGEVVA
jgi:hypothetical protein